jgi:hypothetical protein
MKALSVRAPWWLAILDGGKDIENRDWHTNFRGRIYLHAGKWFNRAEIVEDLLTIKKIMNIKEHPDPLLADLFRPCGGCIVGTVEIVDCVSESSSPWFFGKYGFVLQHPVALNHPVPFKGMLGFFEVPDGTVKEN